MGGSEVISTGISRYINKRQKCIVAVFQNIPINVTPRNESVP